MHASQKLCLLNIFTAGWRVQFIHANQSSQGKCQSVINRFRRLFCALSSKTVDNEWGVQQSERKRVDGGKRRGYIMLAFPWGRWGYFSSTIDKDNHPKSSFPSWLKMEKTKLISRSVKYVPGLPYRQEVSASNSIKSTRPSMETSRLTGSTILGADFYNQMVHDLARALLGKVIVRQMDDGVLVKGRIVETEGNH